jgi:hypothetical protein
VSAKSLKGMRKKYDDNNNENVTELINSTQREHHVWD